MNILDRMNKIREVYTDQNQYFNPYFLMTNDDIINFLKAHDESIEEVIIIAKKWKDLSKSLMKYLNNMDPNMKLEFQLTPLDISKKLKLLKVEQNSQFYWQKINGVWQIRFGKYDEDVFSAFSIAELGELIPNYFESFKNGVDDRWYAKYQKVDARPFGKNITTIHTENSKLEVNCRGQMLIYLIESGNYKI